MFAWLAGRGRVHDAPGGGNRTPRVRRGATMVEYCLLLVLVAVVAVLTVKAMAGGVNKSFVAAEANLAPS